MYQEKKVFYQTGSRKKSVPLRWVNVPPLTNELCIKSYGPVIYNSMICAGYEKGILFFFQYSIAILCDFSEKYLFSEEWPTLMMDSGM